MEEKIGTITHYWPKAGAAQIELDHAPLHVGDRIRIRGKDHEFEQEVDSLQIEHATREEGRPGEPVAIAVLERVHEHDEVFLIKE